MNIQFLDLKRVNDKIKEEINRAISGVLDSGWYILGEAGERFEMSLKKSLVGDEEGYVVGCNSGTDALILALLAAGVGSGDEVITVSHTAIPTICAICSVGAKPVFVDVDPGTWLMDTELVAETITERTKAVIPVHLYGNMVDVKVLAKLLDRMGRSDITIIEDVAQAQGTMLTGRQAGTLGHFGAFSFYPSKNIGALGDGGAVFCKNANDYGTLKMLRNYGQKDRYHKEISKGLNSRLDEVQAAVLDVKIKYIAGWNRRKSVLMKCYRNSLARVPITFQKVTSNCEPAWHLCVIAVESGSVRDGLMDHLRKNSVQTLVHYPVPNHLQKGFWQTPVQTLPITESITKRVLSLPLNISLTDDELNFVVHAIRSFFSL